MQINKPRAIIVLFLPTGFFAIHASFFVLLSSYLSIA
jgi:hypothetical protein